MSSAGTLEQLAEAVGVAFACLSDDLTPDRLAAFLLELGLEELTDLSGDPQFQQKVSAAVDALASLTMQVGALEDAFAKDDLPGTLAAAAAVVQSLAAGLTAFDAVAADLKRAAQSTSAAASAASFSTELVDRIIEYAVVCQLERSSPVVLCLLEVLTIVERNAVTLGTGAAAITVLRRRAYLSRLSTLINDPLSLLKAGYGWGTETLQLPLLLERLARLLLATGILTGDVLDDNGNPAPAPGLDLFFLTVGTTTDLHPPGLAAILVAGATPSSTIALYQPSPEWQLNLELDGAFQQGLPLELLPPAKFDLGSAFTPAPGGATVRLLGQAADPSSPFVIFGIAGGSQLQAKRVEAALTWSLTAAGSAAGELSFEAKVTGGAAVLSSQGSDGFLSQVLPAQFTANFDFGLTWSPERGFAFSGAAGLDATIPVGLSLGPIAIPSLHVALVASNAGLQAELSATVGLSIGPVQTLVDRIGVLATINSSNTRGNLAIADVAFSYKPPSGVGLLIDAAGVSGGGFLDFNPATREYSGVLQLEYIDCELQAFGLIDTQVPGAGYSLLALVDSNFPPIPLGWGFTLNGVGGLLAVNRSASVDALRAALKADKLSTILFPKSAITNASQLLGQLDAYFPNAPGRFLFGPMASIGWGTPTLLTAAIAVIVELPEPIRIILLARLAARIPSASAAIVQINMDALGVLDLSQSDLSLDATLYDSRLAGYTLTGDMALRATWATQREFVLAIGGIHPQFTPPAGFPSLQRVTIDMPSGIVSKLRLEAYLAITSNTVQFGATLDAFIGVAGFGLSGHLGFDALLQLDPFHFDADISGSVALTAGGDDLVSVGLDATLSGPTIWRISGSFKVHILFFDVQKSFYQSWGSDSGSQPIAPVSVLPLLTAALSDVRNWGARLAAATPALVSLRSQDQSSAITYPLASIEVHESVVPLDLQIARFGAAPLAGADTFTIADLLINGSPVPTESVQDDFAPGQFFDLTDDEKLARPSFEKHDAGLSVGAGLINSGPSVTKTMSYETFYVDQAGGALRTDAVPPRPLLLGELEAVLAIGPAGRAAIRTAGNRRYTAPGSPVIVAELAFVVVDNSSLALVGIGPTQGATYTSVKAMLAAELASAPGRRAQLGIVATHEIAA